MNNKSKLISLATSILIGLGALVFMLTGNQLTAATLIVIMILFVVSNFYLGVIYINQDLQQIPQNDKELLSTLVVHDYSSKSTNLKWTILDPDGANAELHRIKTIKPYKKISHIKEYQWGKGALEDINDVTINGQNGHTIETLKREGSRDVLVIGLDKEYDANDELTIDIVRKIKNGFTFPKEWVELLITTDTEFAVMEVSFPSNRTFNYAYGIHKKGDYSKNIKVGEEGLLISEDRQSLKWIINTPIYNTFYTIVWEW